MHSNMPQNVRLAILCLVLAIVTPTQGRYAERMLQAWKRNCNCGNNNTVSRELSTKCQNNGFIYNPDPTEYTDRYVCYRGLGEFCSSGYSPYNENRCMKGLTCACGICQNCISNGTMVMCDVRLCPQKTSTLEVFNSNKISDLY